ncbi:hypothetical protein [Paenibacillus sp. SN-8-1]|uniref:hypothetical protein n=1 Tax=Paenibacillus sp. SN-8-1 TaxID=3435409 RepID=UPI003D9A78E1
MLFIIIPPSFRLVIGSDQPKSTLQWNCQIEVYPAALAGLVIGITAFQFVTEITNLAGLFFYTGVITLWMNGERVINACAGQMITLVHTSFLQPNPYRTR